MKQTGICRHCGGPLYEGMKFCGACGKPAEPRMQPGQAHQPGRVQQPGMQQKQAQQPGMQQKQAQQPGMQQKQAQQPGKMQHGKTQQPGSTEYDPNTYENRVRRQHNNPNGQRRPGYEDQLVRENQLKAKQQQKYRQEEMERDWQQSWDRAGEEEDDGRFTPIQYVLVGLTVVLLMALVGFGVYWILGRSTGNTGKRPQQNQAAQGTVQTENLQEEVADIQILDDTQDKETNAPKQTEEIQILTEQPTESETEEPQTEKQTETPREASVLTYPEFKVTIPGTWWGKYGIEQSDGAYTFYQQASRDAGYGGILFIISRHTDMSYKTLPNYEVIGTGDGAALVYRLSNDLQYPKENAAVAAEYQAMANDVADIRQSIQVLISGEGPRETEALPEIQIFSEDYYVIEEPKADQQEELIEEVIIEDSAVSYEGGYLPQSSSRALSDADVAGMSYDDLQMAINEIYARHGRIFQNESIAAYFNSQPWYNGTVSAENFSESVFSSVESQNIQFLLKQMGN